MLEQVNYEALDRAKNAFIEASRRTLSFAEGFGFVPGQRLGASANVFALDLRPFLSNGQQQLFISLLPEGLDTADDARTANLTTAEKQLFWRNIAFKTLSCLTNDAASSGMQTILIALYLPSSTPEIVFDEPFLQGFLGGFVDGCRNIGCVWISGETPQLKGKIVEDKLDVAGALFALVPPGRQPIDGTQLQAGNKIVLLASSGPHENGFTTLRKLAADLPGGYRSKLADGQEFWQAINAPSVLYTPLIQKILADGINVTSIENITGHGWRKLMRSQQSLRYLIHETLPVPEVFKFVEQQAAIGKQEMLEIFNYGAGCAVFVDSDESAARVVEISRSLNINAVCAGVVQPAQRREVVIEPFGVTFADESLALKRG